MKQQVLKALANPARIFYVPYDLALFNFITQFLIYVIIFVIGVSTSPNLDTPIDPLYFLLSVVVVHFILMFFSRREPQLMQIILAKLRLFVKFIPRVLKV
jgi:type IV secretory pathway VirB3-like protein